jgi:hypothetical protein
MTPFARCGKDEKDCRHLETLCLKMRLGSKHTKPKEQI